MLVDESGDRGGKARYYLLALVIHDQADSISDIVARYEESLRRSDLPNIPFHSEPLLNGHGPYRGMSLEQRKKMLYSFNEFARRLPIEYTGLNRHQYDLSVGLFDTALSAEDYARMKLQDSLLNPDGTTRDRDNAMVVTSEIVDARGGSESDKPKKHVKILNLGGSREAAASPQEAKPRAGAPLKRDWSTTPWPTRALSSSMPRGKNGCLWVVGGAELDARMDGLVNQGARFEFSLRGSKATGDRSAWWLKGCPEMTDPEWSEFPVVAQEKLDALEPGDTVFHEAFGYGKAVDVDREHGTIGVIIGVDKKGKSKRYKYLFPNVLEQGLLTI